jgi:2-polyprenyl-3-methyl-5-hydroxy-6-metoxy-1,4-benzoquinol methylase
MFNPGHFDLDGIAAGDGGFGFEEDYFDAVQQRAFRDRLEGWREDPSLPVWEGWLRRIEDVRVDTGRPPGGRLLDVGCAFGTFLRLAAERGWEPHGVEVSRYASALAREGTGFDVFTGDLEDYPAAPGGFDLVTFWDVIEHVCRPRANLATAFRLLRPGGLLLLTTDNFDGLVARLGALAYRATGGRLAYPVRKFFIPHNSLYLKPADLQRMVERAGFETTTVELLDYPLAKVNVTAAERALVRLLYTAGDLLRMNTGFLLLASKSG